MIRILLFLLLLITLTQITFAQTNGLNFTISTDKERYILGEPVTVKLVWQNVTDKDFKIATFFMMGSVEVFDEDAKDNLQYSGFIACGSGGYLDLRAG
ncbi:MAG: hypothetical protein H7Z37_11930, partial [Pyrinomonadaceae bacterium]|nr:hypothetical protein [Pyrinomonadaceae bacterium]